MIGKVSESLAGAYAELFERLPGEASLNVDEAGHKIYLVGGTFEVWTDQAR